MSSPLSLSTANSLNRRPAKREPSPLNPLKSLPVADYTPLDRPGHAGNTMGLGKTVQALSLILARPSRDPAFKTTLVVAPVALLKQWEREIQSKVKPAYRLKTCILHGAVSSRMTVSKLLSYDVVLTTYGKVAAEYKASPKQRKKKPPLLLANDARFHRIILDEAHNIKNRRSGRSQAVCGLKATYRLCMTGTPFMNDTTEIFSLVRFLRISPYDSWDCFYPDIAKPIQHWGDDERSSAMVKLQVLFRSITLRRTKTSILDGQQIIQLPALAVDKSEVEFDEDQRAFYNALEMKQRLEANKYLKAGLDGGNYAHILALLLRLRQACCHPHLIKDQGIPDGVQIDPEEMIELAQNLREPIVARIQSQKGFQCPMCNIETGNPIINYPCGHYICGGCFTTMMEMRHLGAHLGAATEDVPEPTCPQPGCPEKVEPDQVLCYNYFLEAYEDDGSEDEASGDDDDEEEYKHEDDADARGNLKGFVVSDEGEDEGEDEEDFAKGEPAKEESAGEDEDNKDSDTLNTIRRSVSEISEPLESADGNETEDAQHNSTEGEASDDSDNDSLPSLEEIRQQVFGQQLLAKGQPAEAKDDCASHESRSEVATSRGKRKRNSIDETNESRKKAKIGGTSQQPKPRKGKGFQSLAALKKEASRNVAAKAKYLMRLRKDFVSSAKIDRTMEVLHAIRQENTREKTLVFSLWTSFLDLLEIPIHDQGFRYTRYDGSMQPKDRDAAVSAFMERPEIEVMLVSLMAGNAGLNLTAATRVVILEPFWNPFVEDQAIDRAHRIGQDRPVTVHRVLIAGTVEDRIQELQEKKRRLVNAALSEEGVQTTSRLSARELRGLFGLH
ncbi:hypothetical protein SLS62_007993 [Diatrype stigma]|uniref:Uncharacterized protein n=1 Tax=Diatrype stigma TaxID=117547 RepID=A0AAN9YQA0_9PEZI